MRQRTILNLSSHFEAPRARWAVLAQRIEALLHGQLDQMPVGLDVRWDTMAQQYAARIIRDRGEIAEEGSRGQAEAADYQRVDLSTLDRTLTLRRGGG